jgi:hypothetical protein
VVSHSSPSPSPSLRLVALNMCEMMDLGARDQLERCSGSRSVALIQYQCLDRLQARNHVRDAQPHPRRVKRNGHGAVHSAPRACLFDSPAELRHYTMLRRTRLAMEVDRMLAWRTRNKGIWPRRRHPHRLCPRLHRRLGDSAIIDTGRRFDHE